MRYIISKYILTIWNKNISINFDFDLINSGNPEVFLLILRKFGNADWAHVDKELNKYNKCPTEIYNP